MLDNKLLRIFLPSKIIVISARKYCSEYIEQNIHITLLNLLVPTGVNFQDNFPNVNDCCYRYNPNKSSLQGFRGKLTNLLVSLITKPS